METRLDIFYLQDGEAKLRASAEKWTFQDVVMGEQYVMVSVNSEKPIDWHIGDYCEFRGERYTLNYKPAATQKASTDEAGDAFVYENIKFDSASEELTRAIMLDITSTTGEYVAALGTNYGFF